MKVVGRVAAGTVQWLEANGRDTFQAWDFRLGLAAGALAGSIAGVFDQVRDDAVNVLITEAALGAGLLAIVLAALAILVTFLDDHYRQILQLAPRGVRGAMVPYETVAVLGGLAAAVGLISAITWPALPWFGQATLLALTTMLMVWAAAGTVQLVRITTSHGLNRLRRLEVRDELQLQLEERKKQAQQKSA